MPQLSKNDLRGFLVPYKLTKDHVWSSQSTFTQDEFFASTPKAENPSKMTIKATGSPQATADYQVITREAGINRSARFSIRNNTDSNTIEYGNDAPSSISYIETLAFKQTGIAGETGLFPSTLSFEDGTLLVATQYKDLASPIQREIKVYRRDKDGNVTNTTVYQWQTLTGITQNAPPSLCALDDGSVLLIFPFEKDNFLSFHVYRSTDRGATFSIASLNVVDYNIEVGSGASQYLLKGIKAASCNGQVLLLVETFFNTATNAQNRLFQFVSVDGGGSFKLVTESLKLDDSAYASVNLIVRNNQFCIAYIGSLTQVHYMTLPHAFYQIQDMKASGKFEIAATRTALAGGSDLAMTDADLCLWLDDSNDIWLAFHEHSNDWIGLAFSVDGFTFKGEQTGVNTRVLFFMDIQTSLNHVYLKNMTAVSYLGGSVMACNFSAQTSVSGDSLSLLFLGSYSTQPSLNIRSTTREEKTPFNRKSFYYQYLPFETPPNTSEATTTGTGTENLSIANTLRVQVTSAQTDRKYEYTIPDSTEGGYVKSVIYDVSIGTGANKGRGYIEVTSTQLSKLKSGVKILFEESHFYIYDSVSGALLATVGQNNVTGTEVFIAVRFTSATVWYKNMGNDNLRKYTVALDTTTLATTASASTHLVSASFGIEGSPSTGTAISKFKMFFVGGSDRVGENIISQDNDEIAYRSFPDIGNRLYIDDKINIAVQNGVSYFNDSWQLLPESQNPIDNVFHLVSPTPRNFWVSSSVGSGSKSSERIAFNLDKSGSSNVTELGNDIIGLHLGNINFRMFKLQYHNGVSWVNIADVDTSSGMNHGYVKRGLTIIQDKTNVVNQSYYFFNELKGFVAECTVGATVTYHRIVSNSEGVFGNSNAKACTILLESAPSGNGTVKIIPTSVTVAVSLNGIQASSWAVFIDTQETIDLNFRIGHLSLGPIAITGTQYSRGRQILIESGAITTEQPDRTAYTKIVSPVRRRVDLAWSDGVDISAFYDNNPDPDFYKSSSTGGSLAVSNYQDAPYLMEGLLTYLQGNQLPLVYLPAITTASDLRIFNRRAEHLLATIEGDISIESVTGDELRGDGQGEVMRVGTITVQEVV